MYMLRVGDDYAKVDIRQRSQSVTVGNAPVDIDAASTELRPEGSRNSESPPASFCELPIRNFDATSSIIDELFQILGLEC